MRSALLTMALLAACSFEDVDPNIPKPAHHTIQIRKLQCGSHTEYCSSIRVRESGLIECIIVDQGGIFGGWDKDKYFVFPTEGCWATTEEITVDEVPAENAPEKTSGEEVVEPLRPMNFGESSTD